MRILLIAALTLASIAIVPSPASACHVVMDSWDASQELPWAEVVWDECGDPRMGVCLHNGDAWTKCVWIVK